MTSQLQDAKKIIELVGVPGVGKSTIYNSLCKSWNEAHNWIYEDRLLAPDQPRLFNFKNWVEYNYKSMLGKKLSKSIPIEYGLRFIKKNKSLASFCWDHLSQNSIPENNQIDLRFRASYFLFWSFCRYEAIWEKLNGKPCLMEEGFLQKSFLMQGTKNPDVQMDVLETYLSLLPLPYAVVHLRVPDNKLVIDRLRSRSKTIASHIDIDNEEMEKKTEVWNKNLNFILEKIKMKGVLVFEINGEEPVRNSVANLKGILSEI